jgi:hypothetical protein
MLSVFRNDGKYTKSQRAFRKLHYVFVVCAAIIIADFSFPETLNVEHCIVSETTGSEEILPGDVREILTENGSFFTNTALENGTEVLVKRTPFFGVAVQVHGPKGDSTINLKTHSPYDGYKLYIAMLLISLFALFFDMDEYILPGFGINALIMIGCIIYAFLY